MGLGKSSFICNNKPVCSRTDEKIIKMVYGRRKEREEMSKCKECSRYNTCSTRKVFGSLSCNDGFILKKQTNADKIRAMSDEELRWFLLEQEYNGCKHCVNAELEDCSLTNLKTCENGLLDWLKREEKE